MTQIEQDENSNDSTKNNIAKRHSYANSANVEVLASSANTVSSHLNCAKVTLKPGTGLAQVRSECAEFYYILRGRGHFSQEYNVEDDKYSGRDIVQNEYIIVEPWK
jgi:mannose-6-phosphate isomerase-like protein (cupin superfamily)